MPRLRRVSPDSPGWTRRRQGKGFVYLDEDGRPPRPRRRRPLQGARDPAGLDSTSGSARRPTATSRPSAPTRPVGASTCTTRHGASSATRPSTTACSTSPTRLPVARARSSPAPRPAGHATERALAPAFRLLDLGFFRVGGEHYAEENGSYGLATIEKQHVNVKGDEVVFDYAAKSGQERLVAVADEPSSRRRRRRCKPASRRRRRAARVPGRAPVARRDLRRHQPLRQGRRRRRRVGEGLPHVARHRAGRRRPRRQARGRRASPTSGKRGRADGDDRGRRVPRQHADGRPQVPTSIPRSSTPTRAARRSRRRSQAGAAQRRRRSRTHRAGRVASSQAATDTI